MAELVFVHGVAARSGADYETIRANRDKLFWQILFQSEAVEIRSPMWGDFVPRIDPAIFDTSRKTSASFSLVSSPGSLGNELVGSASPADGEASLADVARANPTVALDALYAELVDQFDERGEALPPEQLAAFAAAADAIARDEDGAGGLGEDRPAARSLVGDPASDDDLQLRLQQGQAASFGIGSALHDALGAVTDRLRSVITKVGLDPLADHLRPAVGLFLGDVFTYLHDGAVRDRVRGVVRESLVAAHEARGSGKLVAIGHSLGGVILADLLSAPEAAGLPANLKVDALLTVGSQPGLFQSLRLFAPDAPPLPKPACVGRWINVFDPMDPLAFRANPIWPDVQDLSFDSITGLASAHTTYFKRPQFFGRCRKRLTDAGVIGAAG